MKVITYKNPARHNNKDRQQPEAVEGKLLDTILVGVRKNITLPSGLGGILSGDCDQYISETRYLVKNCITNQVDIISPYDVLDITETENVTVFK